MAKRFEGWTIVFDLDGTLVNTAPDLLDALNHVLVESGLQTVDLPTISTMIGHGAKAMIVKGMTAQGAEPDADRMDALFDQFLAYYEANIAVGSRPFENALDALDALTDEGAILAVCTNKRQRSTDRLLDALQISEKFAAIVGADSVPDRKHVAAHVGAGTPHCRHEASVNKVDVHFIAALGPIGIDFLAKALCAFFVTPVFHITLSRLIILLSNYFDMPVLLSDYVVGRLSAHRL